MRPELNPLDLNNYPDDHSKDPNKHPNEEDTLSCVTGAAAAAGYRRKKGSGKDESGKIYQCRFCSLKFGKSQALGGHMNRHRQERETEILNRARQLVFSTDNLALPHLGGQPIRHGEGFHHIPPGGNAGDSTTFPFRSSIYQPNLITPASYYSSQTSLQLSPHPPPPGYLYASSSMLPASYLRRTGVSSNTPYLGPSELNFTCIGTPVGGGLYADISMREGGPDGSLNDGSMQDGY